MACSNDDARESTFLIPATTETKTSEREDDSNPTTPHNHFVSLVWGCVHVFLYIPLGMLMFSIVLVFTGLRMASCECLLGASLPPSEFPNDKTKLFFDGGGWGFHFCMGVAQYLMVQYDRNLLRQTHIYAVSSGNLAALAFLLEEDPGVVIVRWFEPFLNAMLSRPLYGFCDTLSPLRELLQDWLPHNAWSCASGRYHCVVSNWPCLGFHVVSQYASNEELIDAVVASCSLPGFVWKPVVSYHRGWLGCWFDAAFQMMITPLDRYVDLAVRPFEPAPFYDGPPSLVPIKKPNGLQPVAIDEVLHLMRMAHIDAEQFLKNSEFEKKLGTMENQAV